MKSAFSLTRRTALALAIIGGTAACFAQNSPSNQSANRPTPGGSYNQPSSATTSSTSRSMAGSDDKLGFMDRRFVSKTADAGHDEVQLAQLAAQRAMNPDVRQFAEKLVKDHTAVNDELKSIASSKNVKLDQEDGKERTYRRLNAKSGADFDREFVEHMVDSHEDGIRRFEKAAKDAKDSEIRSFAAKHVDRLRQHLQQGQSLLQSTMPTGRADANAPTSPQADGTTSTINNNASSTTPSSAIPSTQSTNTGGTNPKAPNNPKY